MIDAFRVYAPEAVTISRSVTDATADLGFLRLAMEPWTKLDDVSIDYAIMEKAKT